MGICTVDNRFDCGAANLNDICDVLCAYWKCDEPTGTDDFADIFGNFDISVGAVTQTSITGIINTARGSTTDIVGTTYSSADCLSIQQTGGTVWLWYMHEGPTTDSLNEPMEKTDEWVITTSEASTGDWRFSVVKTSGGGGTIIVSTTANNPTPMIDVWYLVMAWVDQSAETINIRVRGRNGDDVSASTSYAGETLETAQSSALMLNGGGGNNNTYSDEMGIATRNLSDTEKDAIWNNGNGVSFNSDCTYTLGGCTTNCVTDTFDCNPNEGGSGNGDCCPCAWYDFNESSIGDDALDAIGGVGTITDNSSDVNVSSNGLASNTGSSRLNVVNDKFFESGLAFPHDCLDIGLRGLTVLGWINHHTNGTATVMSRGTTSQSWTIYMDSGSQKGLIHGKVSATGSDADVHNAAFGNDTLSIGGFFAISIIPITRTLKLRTWGQKTGFPNILITDEATWSGSIIQPDTDFTICDGDLQIDSCVIFPCVLTSTQIDDIYNGGAGVSSYNWHGVGCVAKSCVGVFDFEACT